MKRKHQKEWEILEKFSIGTEVIVHARFVDISNAGAHVWVIEPCVPFTAWVSGCSWRCDGKVLGGTCYSSDPYEPPEDAGNYLNIEKKTPVFLVRKFAFGKEIEVPVTEISRVNITGFPGDKDYPPHAPLLTNTQPKWDERSRRALREEMKNVPRDEKGRWKKTQL